MAMRTLTVGLIIALVSEQVNSTQVARFQANGVAVSDSKGIYRGPLSRTRAMDSMTLCGRFSIFFLHSRGCFFTLEDTVLDKTNVLRGEVWIDRVRPVIAGTYNFQVLKKPLWAYRWYHLCFTYDSVTHEIKTYLDGEMSNYQVYDVGGAVRGDMGILGQGTSVSSSFSGDLSQVNVWDYVLSIEQIQSMAKCEDDLQGNYISWDVGFDLQNATAYDLPLSSLCQQNNGPFYFWFPFLVEEIARYICVSLGSFLPTPNTHEDCQVFFRQVEMEPKLEVCQEGIWTTLNDKGEEGVWKSGEGDIVSIIPWRPGEPNGLIYENCAAIRPGGLDDDDCLARVRCAVCTFHGQQRFSLLGICERELRNVYFVAYQEDVGLLVFKSYGEYHIRRDQGQWTWFNAVSNYTVARMEESKPDFPMGRRWWMLEREVCGQEAGVSRLILLTPCSPHHFTCDNAQCVSLQRRCDLKYDCEDRSDEFECQLVEFPENYQPHLPPRPYGKQDESLPITFDIRIESLAIETIEMTFDVTYEITMTWVDSRIQFLNIKRNQSMNPLKREVIDRLWIPMASFVNTGDIHHTEVDEEANMYVNRLAGPDKRHEATPAEVDVFYGQRNSLSIRRKYRTVYMCNFVLVLYPFDVQLCEMHIRILSASKELLTFDSINSTVVFVPSPLLLEYEVGRVTTHYNNSGYYSDARVRIPLSRLYGYAMLNIYIPSFILIIVSFTTLFFRISEFDVRMMSALTAQLVIATLFSQVSSSLPRSSYFKMVDIWLLFCIGITFLVIILHAAIDNYINDVSTPAITKVEPFGHKSGRSRQMTLEQRSRRMVLGSRWLVLLLFALFNACYWGYILA